MPLAFVLAVCLALPAIGLMECIGAQHDGVFGHAADAPIGTGPATALNDIPTPDPWSRAYKLPDALAADAARPGGLLHQTDTPTTNAALLKMARAVVAGGASAKDAYELVALVRMGATVEVVGRADTPMAERIQRDEERARAVLRAAWLHRTAPKELSAILNDGVVNVVALSAADPLMEQDARIVLHAAAHRGPIDASLLDATGWARDQAKGFGIDARANELSPFGADLRALIPSDSATISVTADHLVAARARLIEAVRTTGLAALRVPPVVWSNPTALTSWADRLVEANTELQRTTGLPGQVLGLNGRVLLALDRTSSGTATATNGFYLLINADWGTLGHESFHTFDMWVGLALADSVDWPAPYSRSNFAGLRATSATAVGGPDTSLSNTLLRVLGRPIRVFDQTAAAQRPAHAWSDAAVATAATRRLWNALQRPPLSAFDRAMLHHQLAQKAALMAAQSQGVTWNPRLWSADRAAAVRGAGSRPPFGAVTATESPFLALRRLMSAQYARATAAGPTTADVDLPAGETDPDEDAEFWGTYITDPTEDLAYARAANLTATPGVLVLADHDAASNAADTPWTMSLTEGRADTAAWRAYFAAFQDRWRRDQITRRAQ